MHWFGELLALYIIIAALIFTPLAYVTTKKRQAERKSEELSYERTVAWGQAFRKLYDANAAVIAETDAMPGILSKAITEELLSAHETARPYIQGGFR